jgi:hypothetical protein
MFKQYPVDGGLHVVLLPGLFQVMCYCFTPEWRVLQHLIHGALAQVPSATEMARKKGLSSRVGPKFSPNCEFAKVQTWLRCGDG